MPYVDEATRFFSEQVDYKDGRAYESGHRDAVNGIGWNSTGTRLGTGSSDKTAAIWNVRSTKVSKIVDCIGHTKTVEQLGWSPTSPDTMATASTDKTGENINMCWSPDGNAVAVGNKTDLVSIFDVRTNTVLHEEQFEKNCEVNEIRWNTTGDLFFATTGDGTIKVLTYPGMKEPGPALPGHTANCISINFDPKGKYFATGSADTLINLWSATELMCVRTFGQSEWPCRNLSFSFDGQLLAYSSDDQFLKLTYVETGEIVHKIAVDVTYCVAWHPKELVLAFAGNEKASGSGGGGGRDSGGVVLRLFGHPKP
eukprot:gene6611-9681_t